jgi:SAM-dependent methyltransferase
MRPLIHEEVQRVIAAVERDAPGGFDRRAAALELLEVHVLDRLQYLEELAPLEPGLLALRARATTLHKRLEAANQRLLRRLRRRIGTGKYTPEGLKRALARYAGQAGRDGYDVLDRLVGALLADASPPEPRVELEPEMVAYQPTPARAILTLLDRTHLGPDDTLVDVGSGPGYVAILVALLCGARATGIELEPAYCDHARRCAARLNVPRVEFIQGDAREASLADGTVFFLYTPFRGALLRQVLERLRAEAKVRPIRVCTYGPCTAEMASVGWLRPADGRNAGEHEVAVFHAAGPGLHT